jgi:hypothetical protein
MFRSVKSDQCSIPDSQFSTEGQWLWEIVSIPIDYLAVSTNDPFLEGTSADPLIRLAILQFVLQIQQISKFDLCFPAFPV